jgi:hypothetical protein
MLAQLLTPLLIATAPMTVIVPEMQYNHGTQMVERPVEEIYQSRTWNGTQTFDWQGRPNDSDND